MKMPEVDFHEEYSNNDWVAANLSIAQRVEMDGLITDMVHLAQEEGALAVLDLSAADMKADPLAFDVAQHRALYFHSLALINKAHWYVGEALIKLVADEDGTILLATSVG